jgi:hypothetical protein
MGNKNTSVHLTKSLSTHGQEHQRYIQHQHDMIVHDHSDASLDTSSSYQSATNKKHGPSPRCRRRPTRQVQIDRKAKKSQVC